MAEREQDLPSRARLLVERQRAGELEPAALELAAWVGDPAATLALDAPPPCWDDAARFSHGLEELGGRAALGRLGLGLIRRLTQVSPAAKGLWSFERAEARNYEASVLCPCADHAHGFRLLSTPTYHLGTRDLVSLRAPLLLGAEGLEALLAGVVGRRRLALPESLQAGGRDLARWVLWGDDPLRADWATSFSRRPLEELLERLLETGRLRPVDAFSARLDLVGEVLDPEWGELVGAWGDADDPRDVELSIHDWIEWRREEPFEGRDDPLGMWQAFLEGSPFDAEQTRARLLAGMNADFDYTFNFQPCATNQQSRRRVAPPPLQVSTRAS